MTQAENPSQKSPLVTAHGFYLPLWKVIDHKKYYLYGSGFVMKDRAELESKKLRANYFVRIVPVNELWCIYTLKKVKNHAEIKRHGTD